MQVALLFIFALKGKRTPHVELCRSSVGKWRVAEQNPFVQVDVMWRWQKEAPGTNRIWVSMSMFWFWHQALTSTNLIRKALTDDFVPSSGLELVWGLAKLSMLVWATHPVTFKLRVGLISFLIEVLISTVKQNDSVIHTYIYILFHIPFHYGLLQNNEHSSLCYTVGIVVYPFYI